MKSVSKRPIDRATAPKEKSILITLNLSFWFFMTSPAKSPDKVVAVKVILDKNQVYCVPSSKEPKIKLSM